MKLHRFLRKRDRIVFLLLVVLEGLDVHPAEGHVALNPREGLSRDMFHEDADLWASELHLRVVQIVLFQLLVVVLLHFLCSKCVEFLLRGIRRAKVDDRHLDRSLSLVVHNAHAFFRIQFDWGYVRGTSRGLVSNEFPLLVFDGLHHGIGGLFELVRAGKVSIRQLIDAIDLLLFETREGNFKAGGIHFKIAREKK